MIQNAFDAVLRAIEEALASETESKEALVQDLARAESAARSSDSGVKTEEAELERLLEKGWGMDNDAVREELLRLAAGRVKGLEQRRSASAATWNRVSSLKHELTLHADRHVAGREALHAWSDLDIEGRRALLREWIDSVAMRPLESIRRGAREKKSVLFVEIRMRLSEQVFEAEIADGGEVRSVRLE
jgi:hypothetical protein